MQNVQCAPLAHSSGNSNRGSSRHTSQCSSTHRTRGRTANPAARRFQCAALASRRGYQVFDTQTTPLRMPRTPMMAQCLSSCVNDDVSFKLYAGAPGIGQKKYKYTWSEKHEKKNVKQLQMHIPGMHSTAPPHYQRDNVCHRNWARRSQWWIVRLSH